MHALLLGVADVSEQSASDQQRNLGRPLLFSQKGFVVAFRNFAWAPNRNKRIPNPKKIGDPPHYVIFGQTGGYFKKLSWGSETFYMTSEGLGEMFEADSADTC